jgi:hypothetical protein
MDSLEELSAQRIRAETLQELNTQSAQQTQLAVIAALVERSKTTVPYADDPKARQQFDNALSYISKDPDFEGKPFAILAEEAHRLVLARRGAVPDSTKPAKPVRATPDVPVTLGGLPNAGGATERTVADVLAGLSGPEFEAAFDSLPSNQKANYFKQA